jgi:hypothetical protein
VAAPAPLSITRRPGAGANGSDRLTIIWRDGAIRNRWLEVTVKPTADTNLSAPHVFLFGSLVGETGTAPVGAKWTVDGADLSRVRAAARRAATSTTDALDFDRDGVIGPRDVSIVRSSVGHSLLAAPLAAAARSAAAAGAPQAAMAPRSSPPPRARRTSYDILGA